MQGKYSHYDEEKLLKRCENVATLASMLNKMCCILSQDDAIEAGNSPFMGEKRQLMQHLDDLVLKLNEFCEFVRQHEKLQKFFDPNIQLQFSTTLRAITAIFSFDSQPSRWRIGTQELLAANRLRDPEWADAALTVSTDDNSTHTANDVQRARKFFYGDMVEADSSLEALAKSIVGGNGILRRIWTDAEVISDQRAMPKAPGFVAATSKIDHALMLCCLDVLHHWRVADALAAADDVALLGSASSQGGHATLQPWVDAEVQSIITGTHTDAPTPDDAELPPHCLQLCACLSLVLVPSSTAARNAVNVRIVAEYVTCFWSKRSVGERLCLGSPCGGL